MINIKADLVDILSELIRIESVTDNEREICDTLYDLLISSSGELIRVHNSLILNYNFNRESTVALVGHLDTVPVGESSIEPTIIDGELWGRGACDMKGGIACMLRAIADIESGELKPDNNVSFLFYEGEEGSIPNGINRLIDSKKLNHIDFAFILEPTEGRYSIGCLGCLAVKKEVFGIAAHSATSKKGKSSLLETFEVFSRINQMDKKISNTSSIDGLEYYETVNITTLETENRAFNVIPSKTEMVCNYRFGPDKSVDEAMVLLKKYYGEDNITLLDSSDSCYIGNSGDKFLKAGIKKEIMQAWTDIAQLNRAGIPAINFGAGSITVAHKKDERINIEELRDFYKVLISHL